MPPPPGQSASPAYRILQGETISVIVWSNVAVTLASSWRVQYDDGSDDRISTDAFTTGATRAAQYMLANQVARLDGYVTEGVVLFEGTGPTQRGQTYVQALVIMNPDTPTTTRQVIAASYIYPGHAPTLGEIVEPGPAGGHGAYSARGLAAPAAGADFSADLGLQSIFKIRGFSAQLVTAVAGANRFFHMTPKTGGGSVLTELVSDAVQTASLTINYRGIPGISPKTAAVPALANGGFILVSLDDFPILAAGTVSFTTDNIQGADQWGAGVLYVEEWVMPN